MRGGERESQVCLVRIQEVTMSLIPVNYYYFFQKLVPVLHVYIHMYSISRLDSCLCIMVHPLKGKLLSPQICGQ